MQKVQTELITGSVLRDLTLKPGLFSNICHRNLIAMDTNATTNQTPYTSLYKYLLVMNEEQITRLRKVVTGNLSLQTFTDQEVHVLEARLLLTQHAPAR